MTGEGADEGPAVDAGLAVDAAGARMVEEGLAIRLETTGRVTGRPVAVVVGYVEDEDGSLLVAAGDISASWASNLRADPRCRVTLGSDTADFVAERLDAAGHARAVRELILRYGTPSERLGAGPSFRLRRAMAGPGVARSSR